MLTIPLRFPSRIQRTAAHPPAAKRLCQRLGVATLGWLLLGAPGMAEDDADWQVGRLAETVALAEHATVEIHNPYGDLRVRMATDGQIAVSALTQRHKDDADGASIAVASTDSTVRISIQYPNGRAPQAGDRRRVDVTVFVPPDPQLRLRTTTGLLNIRADNDMAVETTTGKIDIKTAGVLTARTDRGGMLVVLKKPTWPRVQRLETVTGEIELWLPTTTDATVRATTGGRYTVDFSVDIRFDADEGLRHATAIIGEGGSALEIASKNGAVKLLRSP